MPSEVPVKYADVRVLSHVTEELERVETAVKNVFSSPSSEITFKRTRLKGHYGNPIVLLETRIKDKDAISAFFKKLASDLSSLDREALAANIDQHLQKGNLFMRLDKQSAYLNKLRLRTDDPIRIKLHFRSSTGEQIVKIFRDLGMLP